VLDELDEALFLQFAEVIVDGLSGEREPPGNAGGGIGFHEEFEDAKALRLEQLFGGGGLGPATSASS
jgi:hypothetical protein